MLDNSVLSEVDDVLWQATSKNVARKVVKTAKNFFMSILLIKIYVS
ncbi:hypothetical protein HMPREF3205_01299 [Streptococcus pasteurianus]|nr:hypothetical protein HMPREF3205_01299 [Streptococcus pasteurianus]